MSEAVEQVFKREIAEMVEKEKEQTIENMLKDNVKASNIIKWTGASLEKIATIATRLGMDTLSL